MGRSRRMQRLCATVSGTQEEIWHKLYGTDHVGQLPQWKKDQHEGHCWHPCPYSTQANADRTRAVLELDPTDPLPSKIDHTDVNGMIYYMKTEYKGQWGYQCTFGSSCPGYSDGVSYFYT